MSKIDDFFHTDPEEEIDRVLHYNDEFEDMRSLGMLKFVVYPAKKSMEFLKKNIKFCQKKSK